MPKTHSNKCKCPLCGSLLTKQKYNQVTGIWKDAKREAKRNKQDLEKQKKMLAGERKKVSAEKKKYVEAMKKKNIEMRAFKEKIRKDNASKIKLEKEKALKKQGQQLKKAQDTNRKLKEQLKNAKEGRSEIDRGFEYEKKLTAELKKEYPHDDIKDVGKGGDVLHKIMMRKKFIGSIIYECKRTQNHQSSHVTQTATAKNNRGADFGVLVTSGKITKNFLGFKVERGIIITQGPGAIMVSRILRDQIIEMDRQKLDEEKKNAAARRALNYLNSNDFKGPLRNSLRLIEDSKKSLEKEILSHIRDWTQRSQIYTDIKNNINLATNNSGLAIHGKTLKKPTRQKVRLEIPKQYLK